MTCCQYAATSGRWKYWQRYTRFRTSFWKHDPPKRIYAVRIEHILDHRALSEKFRIRQHVAARRRAISSENLLNRFGGADGNGRFFDDDFQCPSYLGDHSRHALDIAQIRRADGADSAEF